jgi:hypothetical protein
VSGAAMAALGLFVAARFTEDNFIPAREQRWRASLSIVRRGLALARRDHEIQLVFTATIIINGAGVIAWLFPRQLVDLGFPGDPVLWYTALGVLSFALGAIALRIVEARIEGAGAARRTYALACLIGTLGLGMLAFAPDALIGSIGVQSHRPRSLRGAHLARRLSRRLRHQSSGIMKWTRSADGGTRPAAHSTAAAPLGNATRRPAP